MCSICGMIDFHNPNLISQDYLLKMGHQMLHRGPDQHDFFLHHSVGLQHNRLSIMDPEHGLQPMTIHHNGRAYTIVYNGEIYNTSELKSDLKSKGIVCATTCDTEVVLYTYIIYGEQCSAMLNGIYSFAIYDQFMESVYLSRDRFGVKPFYYTFASSTFLFASEVKGLLAHPQVEAKIDREGLWQLFHFAPMKISGTSVFKNILEIKPGYHGFYDKKGLSLSPYWTLESKTFEGTRKDAIEATSFLVTDAIERQLISDVPLATFLSGGLDSSIISSVAQKNYKKNGKQLTTYSFEYEGNQKNFHNTLFQPQSDDEFARYLGSYLGTNHTVLTANIDHLTSLLEDATKFRDLPGMADIDSSLLYYCSKVKEQHTVALSGECADEIFGGYPWFYRKEMLDREFFPWIHNPHTRIGLFQDWIAKPKEGYEFARSIYQDSIAQCNILDTDTPSMKQSRIATWLSTKYFMASLLERKDRMSMASGVEVRVPFADHRILDYVYNIPWEYKFENEVEKSLLRNAMKETLPDSILYRKKSPYPKTHNPQYEANIRTMLQTIFDRKNSILNQIIDKDMFQLILSETNVTWFGQLMSKPQLLAWLIQLNYWFEEYNVDICV